MSESRKKILVVDDQENWRKALKMLLDEEGYEVRTAARFEEAKEVISQEIFELLILDVRLVDEDAFNVQGLELLKLVKSQEMSHPVIILTGYPDSIREGTLDRYGTDRLMLKVPRGESFNREKFLGRVQTLIGKPDNKDV